MKTTLLRNLKIAGLAVLALALGACSSTPMKAYSGSVLPAEQTAIVRSGPYTDLVSVDGMKVRGLSVAVLPGKHTIEMKPSDNQEAYAYTSQYLYYSLVTGTVTLDTVPGHTYQAYVHIAPEPRDMEERSYGAADRAYGAQEGKTIDTSDSGYAWRGYVEDKTASKRVAATDRLPLAVYPRSYPGGFVGGASTMIR
jgi:hypothetical protein